MKKYFIAFAISLFVIANVYFLNTNHQLVDSSQEGCLSMVYAEIIDCGDDYLDDYIYDIVPCYCSYGMGEKKDCIYMGGKCCSEFLIGTCVCT